MCHPRLEIEQVLRLERVGGMVGERTIQLRVQVVQLEGKRFEHGRDDEASHPVGAVHHDSQGPHRRRLHERDHMGHVQVQQVVLGGSPRRRRRLRPRAGKGLDLVEAGLRADGRRTRPTQLDAVVADGIVRCGEHRSGHAPQARSEIHHLRGASADVHHVDARRRHALDEGSRKLRAVRTHVPAHHDAECSHGAGVGGERAADGAASFGVDLLPDDPPDVICLEYRVEIGHQARI